MGALEVSFLGAFVAGFLSFLSPCVLPLVPPYLCFLGGSTLDQILKESESEEQVGNNVFGSAIFFVLGFSTIFVAQFWEQIK